MPGALSPLEQSIREACQECFDTTIALSLYGPVPCAFCLKSERKPISPAAVRLSNRVWELVEMKRTLDRQHLLVARFLAHGSSDWPVSGYLLREWMGLDERQVKAVIETLRGDDWLLPVVSRRSRTNGGYWMAHSAAEYLTWWRTFRAQAIKELATGYRNLNRNYPEYAGQGSLGFISDFTRELQEAMQ